MKKFKEGMTVSFSMLYGGIVTATVSKVTETEVTLTESWMAEDTGKTVSKDTTYKKFVNDNNEEYIIGWEYYEHKCIVYGESC